MDASRRSVNKIKSPNPRPFVKGYLKHHLAACDQRHYHIKSAKTIFVFNINFFEISQRFFQLNRCSSISLEPMLFSFDRVVGLNWIMVPYILISRLCYDLVCIDYLTHKIYEFLLKKCLELEFYFH